MKKLRECKNFGELYETIGEANFENVAYVLTILLIVAPVFAGIVNYFMIQDSYNYITPYNAYEYNYKCMPIWNIVFMLMCFWCVLYYAGKISYNKYGVKNIFSKIKNEQRWMVWWLILLVWTLIPVLFSPDIQGAFLGTSQLASGYISHFYTMGVMGCVIMVANSKKKEEIVWAFIIIMNVLSIIMIAYEYDIPFLRLFTATSGVSVYTNSNHFGYMITLTCLAITGLYYKLLSSNEDKRQKKILFCLISFVVQAFSIIINDTLGSYLAIVVALIAVPFIWLGNKKKIKIICFIPHLILLVLTVLSYYGAFPTKLGSTIGQSLVVFVFDLLKVKQQTEGYRHAGTDRMGLWIDTVKKISESPIVGYGPGVISYRNGKYILWDTPHNEFLECALFMGIPGLVLYLGGLITLCIDKCRNIKKLTTSELIAGGVIIGYLASSFFGVRKYNTVCYFFVFIGLLVGKQRQDYKKEEHCLNDDGGSEN